MSVAFQSKGKSWSHDIRARGYHAAYHPGETNHCPGCGRTHWHVGRLAAECGFCSTALPLADTGTTGVGLLRRHHVPAFAA